MIFEFLIGLSSAFVLGVWCGLIFRHNEAANYIDLAARWERTAKDWKNMYYLNAAEKEVERMAEEKK